MAASQTFDHEAFYDDEVAPVLLDLAQKCLTQGMPFLTLVQYVRREDGTGDYGETAVHLDLSRALTAATRARAHTDPTPHLSGIAMTSREPLASAS